MEDVRNRTHILHETPRPRIEPGSSASQADTYPLYYRDLHSKVNWS